jgi:hypothetical protein
MSMEHKAFVFDYGRFQAELAPILFRALENDSMDDLIVFIRQHQAEIRTPDEGDPLEAGWEKRFVEEGLDRVGAVALTRYYDPLKDIGLDYDWQELGRLFPDDNEVLGVPFGPPLHLFDPGKMGSWFQSPEMVRKHEVLARDVAARLPQSDLRRCIAMFQKAREKAGGLYVTF